MDGWSENDLLEMIFKMAGPFIITFNNPTRGPSRMPRGHHQAPFHKGRVVVEVPPEEKFGCDLPRRGHERGAPGRGMRGAFQPVANKNRFEWRVHYRRGLGASLIFELLAYRNPRV